MTDMKMTTRYVPAVIASPRAIYAAFDGGKPGWKVEPDGSLSKDPEGNPIYIDSTGAEKSVGGSTISTLQQEAKNHRVKAETLAAELKKFEGLDADAARAAIEKLHDVDLDKLVSAGKVEEAKEAVKKVMQKQIDDITGERDTLKGQLDTTLIGYAFSQSKFINDNLAIPPDLAQAQFAKNFGVVNGKVVPVDADGKPLNSNKRAGEIADFDEGIETAVKGYAHADRILKGDNQQGTGNQGGGGNQQQGSAKTIKRAAFDAMSVPDQAKTMRPREGYVPPTIVE